MYIFTVEDVLHDVRPYQIGVQRSNYSRGLHVVLQCPVCGTKRDGYLPEVRAARVKCRTCRVDRPLKINYTVDGVTRNQYEWAVFVAEKGFGRGEDPTFVKTVLERIRQRHRSAKNGEKLSDKEIVWGKRMAAKVHSAVIRTAPSDENAEERFITEVLDSTDGALLRLREQVLTIGRQLDEAIKASRMERRNMLRALLRNESKLAPHVPRPKVLAATPPKGVRIGSFDYAIWAVTVLRKQAELDRTDAMEREDAVEAETQTFLLTSYDETIVDYQQRRDAGEVFDLEADKFILQFAKDNGHLAQAPLDDAA